MTPKPTNKEPNHYIYLGISGAVAVGIAMSWCAFRKFTADGSSWKDVPWTFITALAASPAAVVTWCWRTVHRQADLDKKEAGLVLTNRQQELARDKFEHDKMIAEQIEFSRAFGESLSLLAENTPTSRVAGVVNLVSLAERFEPKAPLVEASLASWLAGDESHRIELQALPPLPPKPAPNQVVTSLKTYAGWEPVAFEIQQAMTFLTKKNRRPDPRAFFGLNLTRINLRNSVFLAPDLRRACLRGADLYQATLGGAQLAGADLAGAELIETKFLGANLRGANLSRVFCLNTSFEGADLADADLTDAVLANANFEGAMYTDATDWPDGFEPPRGAIKKA